MEDRLSKKFYKIKDVSEILNVPQTTLRYWEKEFPEFAPKRTPKNIRIYTPDNIQTLRIIHYLLKVKGLKTAAAKEQIRINRKNVERRIEIIDRLTDLRNELSLMLRVLDKRK